MTIASKIGSVLVLSIFLSTASLAHAQIHITEIMYDAAGSDQKHEWLELTNLGTEALDLSAYSLFEGGTNHKLVVVSGRATLAPLESVIVVEDLKVFQKDWPQYAGSIFKATFSLSNSGEALSIKDKSLHEKDSTFYSATMGAQGDGNSLHRVGNSFTQGAPNPGNTNEAVPPSTKPKQIPPPVPSSGVSTKEKILPTTVAAAAPDVQPTSTPVQTSPVALLSVDQPSSNVPLIEGIAGLGALLALCVAGAWYARPLLLPAPKEPFLTADEFEIE